MIITQTFTVTSTRGHTVIYMTLADAKMLEDSKRSNTPLWSPQMEVIK